MATHTRKQKLRKYFRKNLLTLLTVFGVVGGCATGFILKSSSEEKWTPREVMYIQFAGDIFLRMLKALIIPLLVASVVAAIGSLDLSLSKKIGFRAISYYATTTVLAVIEGIILVTLIQPGGGEPTKIHRAGSSRNVTTVDTLLDLVRNMFPPNLIQACIQQYRTVLTYEDNSTSDIKNLLTWRIDHEYADGSNVLGIVVFSVALGIAVGQLGKVGVPLLRLFESLGETMMTITTWVIWLSPVGVFFLVAAKILEMESIAVVIGQLGWYFMTVLLGLFIHGLIVIPFIYSFFTRRLPFRFIANMSQAFVTAFGTASSSATLPISMSCLEEKNHVDVRVSRFVMPIGATINMDGTALYEAVAAIFIAQVRNVPLTLGHIAAVSITATMASIGAAGIPQAGLVTMVMVLDTVGLPAEDVTLIIAVDWLLDRFRTTINVLGDSLGAGIVNELSKEELEKLPEPENMRTGSRKESVKPAGPGDVEWNTTPM